MGSKLGPKLSNLTDFLKDSQLKEYNFALPNIQNGRPGVDQNKTMIFIYLFIYIIIIYLYGSLNESYDVSSVIHLSF